MTPRPWKTWSPVHPRISVTSLICYFPYRDTVLTWSTNKWKSTVNWALLRKTTKWVFNNRVYSVRCPKMLSQWLSSCYSIVMSMSTKTLMLDCRTQQNLTLVVERRRFFLIRISKSWLRREELSLESKSNLKEIKLLVIKLLRSFWRRRILLFRESIHFKIWTLFLSHQVMFKLLSKMLSKDSKERLQILVTMTVKCKMKFNAREKNYPSNTLVLIWTNQH